MNAITAWGVLIPLSRTSEEQQLDELKQMLAFHKKLDFVIQTIATGKKLLFLFSLSTARHTKNKYCSKRRLIQYRPTINREQHPLYFQELIDGIIQVQNQIQYIIHGIEHTREQIQLGYWPASIMGEDPERDQMLANQLKIINNLKTLQEKHMTQFACWEFVYD